jgi:hypothetical protein
MPRPRASSPPLPPLLRDLFWEYNPDALSWNRDLDLITARVLASGTWEAVSWLRARMGNAALRDWIEHHHGRGLNPQQLRFWQLILELPSQRVDAWLGVEGRKVWDRRTRP